MDAGVVAKWALPGEPNQESAVKLKDDLVSGLVELCAPDLVTGEVANALLSAMRLERIAKEDAKEALTALNEMGIELRETTWSQACQALSVAHELSLTVYDALYLLLADTSGAYLVTADRRLCEKAKERFKVAHLRDYPQVTPHSPK